MFELSWRVKVKKKRYDSLVKGAPCLRVNCFVNTPSCNGSDEVRGFYRNPN